MELADTTLTLFFTKRMSLKNWADIGIIDRELALYKRLTTHLNRVNMVTYGGYKDKTYSDRLETIELLPVTWHNRVSPIIQLLIKHFPKVKNTDILKTNQIQGSEIPIWFKKKFRKKLIVRCGYLYSRHMIKRHRKENLIRAAIKLEQKAFTSADIGVVTSAWQREIVVNRYQLDPVKVKVIPNYIITDVFKPIPKKPKKYDLIFIGRGSRQKNIENLLQAINSLKKEKQNVSLVMVGSCCYESIILRLIDKYALDVKLMGLVPNFELPKIINQAKVFILPSYFEGHPKALLEAMSCGIPCIGSNTTGIREDIEHLGTGYLCQTNSTSIAKAIEVLLSDDALQAKLGKNARQYILKNYSLDRILKMELNVIKEVLAS